MTMLHVPQGVEDRDVACLKLLTPHYLVYYTLSLNVSETTDMKRKVLNLEVCVSGRKGLVWNFKEEEQVENM